MKESFKSKSKRVGVSPGDLPTEAVIGTTDQLSLEVITYNDTYYDEKNYHSVEECVVNRHDDLITWINVEGTNQIEEIKKLGTAYHLHPLLLEDIVYADQRPKLDDYETHLFIILKMLDFDKESQEIKIEQISLVLGKNYVISFQEFGKEGDVFGPNRKRIKDHKGKIRKSGADYLLYSLIDTIVDNYFLILEKIGERIEDLESEILLNPTPQKLKTLYTLKRDSILLRKSIWPLREVINKLERQESDMISPSTVIYIKDVYDHTIQIIETIESYRDILGGIMDIYLSSTSNKMNSVMKVLTLISTIFMPLTFIVGIYGMNFDYMPELHWKTGYYSVLGICAVVGAIMILFFKTKKWL